MSPSGTKQLAPVMEEELEWLAAVLHTHCQQSKEQQILGGLLELPPPQLHHQGPGTPSSQEGQESRRAAKRQLPPDSEATQAATPGQPKVAALHVGLSALVAAAAGPGGEEGEDTAGPLFVSWTEKKERRYGGKKPGTGGKGLTVVKFFLVDSRGRSHLAVEGSDQGNANYLYFSKEGFPVLECRNKRDVVAWIEGILEASKLASGYYSGAAPRPALLDHASGEPPEFVGHRTRRYQLGDGRKAFQFFLVDACAREYLAVTGEETEVRDGHYLYRTQGAFHHTRPLECGNQLQVKRWLDGMVAVKQRPA